MKKTNKNSFAGGLTFSPSVSPVAAGCEREREKREREREREDSRAGMKARARALLEFHQTNNNPNNIYVDLSHYYEYFFC
jgi:hypothetical protein